MPIKRNDNLFNIPHHGCTIFAASYGNTVLFGNNEDMYTEEGFRWFLHFHPPSSRKYGYLTFVSDFGKEGGFIEGGVNDHGLAWDANALPPFPLIHHPERTPYDPVVFPTRALSEFSKVSEVIEMAKGIDWGGSFAAGKYYPQEGFVCQFFYADATGDAVAISGGADGEIAFTRKKPGDGYLVSTNFNRANPANGTYPCWRYDTAVAMLERIGNEDGLTLDYSRSILTAVHCQSASLNTIYSNICDLKNGIVYLYYFHQYYQVTKLNLADEFAQGERTIQIRNLFSQETVAAASREYQSNKELAEKSSAKLMA